MKALLLEDANRLFASPSDYEATRQQIEAAAYQTFTLNEADFNDLVFMEANDNVWADNQSFQYKHLRACSTVRPFLCQVIGHCLNQDLWETSSVFPGLGIDRRQTDFIRSAPFQTAL